MLLLKQPQKYRMANLNKQIPAVLYSAWIFFDIWNW